MQAQASVRPQTAGHAAAAVAAMVDQSDSHVPALLQLDAHAAAADAGLRNRGLSAWGGRSAAGLDGSQSQCVATAASSLAHAMSQGASLTAAGLLVGMQSQDRQSAARPDGFQDQSAAAAAGLTAHEMSQGASLAAAGVLVGAGWAIGGKAK